MVAANMAATAHQNGRVKSIGLTQPASSFAQRIGPATGRVTAGVRFNRWVNLDCGARILEHHPRSLYPDPE